jgi:hypothetical protein
MALLPATLPAQDQDIGPDIGFFRSQALGYQRWLDATGIGDALRVDQVRVKEPGKLELLLVVKSTDLDTAIGRWKRLQQDFLAREGYPVTEKLFRVFVHKMEIPPEQGNVQVYVKDASGEYIPCFYVWIWQENAEVQTEARLNECRSSELDLLIRPYALRNIGAAQTNRINSRYGPEAVFEEVLRYARARFETPRCDGRQPRVEEVVIKGNRLSFTVSDLCKEVLRDEQEPIWGKVLNLIYSQDKSFIKRERLSFSFSYNALDGQQGYTLTGLIEGKFGSGIYQPRQSGYIDMEPDFQDYLKTYAINFQNALRERLEKQK